MCDTQGSCGTRPPAIEPRPVPRLSNRSQPGPRASASVRSGTRHETPIPMDKASPPRAVSRKKLPRSSGKAFQDDPAGPHSVPHRRSGSLSAVLDGSIACSCITKLLPLINKSEEVLPRDDGGEGRRGREHQAFSPERLEDLSESVSRGIQKAFPGRRSHTFRRTRSVSRCPLVNGRALHPHF